MTTANTPDDDAPDATDAGSPEDHAYHAAAWKRLRAGRRPTIDDLLADAGGTRTAASAALRTFWSRYVPTRLIEAPLPTRLHELVIGLHNAMHAEAATAAEALTRERAAQLDAREAQLQERTNTILAHEAEHQRVRAEQAAIIATMTGQIGVMQQQLVEAADARKKADARARAHAAVRATADQAREAAESARRVLANEIAEVRATLESERIQAAHDKAAGRDALQEATTRADLATKERDAARTALEESTHDHQRTMAHAQQAHDTELRELIAQHAQERTSLMDAHQRAIDRLHVQLDAARTDAKQARTRLDQVTQRLLRRQVAAPSPARSSAETDDAPPEDPT